MNSSDLQRVRDFDRELLSLTAAGIDLDLGQSAGSSVETVIKQVEDAIDYTADKREAIERVVTENSTIPSRYKAALLTYLRTDDAALALEGLTVPAVARREIGRSIGRTMFYPLLLFVMTFIAFVVLVLLAGSAIESLSGDFEEELGLELTWLTLSRQWIHWWAAIVPIVLVGMVAWWWFESSRSHWRWIPGTIRYYRTVQNAHLAERLSRLVDHGCSIDDALSMAGPIDRDPGREDLKFHSLPVLLRWAVTSQQDRKPSARLLRFVAEAYHQSAIRQRYLWKIVIPGFVGVLIGGLFVLFYGVSLFAPLYEMLDRIASPRMHY